MSERKATKREHSAGVSWRKVRTEILSDPAVRAEYDALKPEFDLIRQLIDLRIKRGLSQRQLAKRAGMQQPSIARLEGGRGGSLLTLRRVADALGADVKVSLVPRRAAAADKRRKRT
jgi:DNA-binding XRE family transcriptional regulator